MGCWSNFTTIVVKSLILFYLICILCLSEGLSHVGEKCLLYIFCKASNSYCDSSGICRCKAEYPVNVTPHDCRRGRRYGHKCQFSEECTYFDPNAYCTQMPYRSVCDCHPDLVYSEEKKLCVEVIPWKNNTQGVLLPSILGISLGIASLLCCCLAGWHCCQKHRFGGESSVFRHLTIRSRSNGNEGSRRSAQAPLSDALPPYEMIIRENDSHYVDELPPTYEEVIKQAKAKGAKEEAKT